MIIAKIKAGLGNQMFQYALAKRLSLDWNDELKFDFSWFDNIKSGETPRELEINKFNITMNRAAESEVVNAKPGFVSALLDRARGRFNRNYFYTFHPRLLKKKKFIYLDGYFQSYKYFDSIRETIIKEFVLKDGFSKEAEFIRNEIQSAGQSVALHVRRGDYVASCKDWNGSLGVTYYQKGLDEIGKKYKQLKLFVFSDDIEWAKENLNFNSPTTFVSRPQLNAAEELFLMSLCKHQIIANSTFSWWAAWLNKNSEKIIVAPSRWLLAADIDTSDLIPPDWIKLSMS